MHYRCLAMSKYGMDREFTVHFEEIDTPTEKERAEINEIDSRTYATYVNAGVITGDEVRERLKEDEDSGFNTLSDEIPEDNEPFDFGEEQEGNGETLQNPFSMDKEWNESDHPRKDNGQFGEGSGSKSTKSKNKPSERHNRVKSRQRKPVRVPKEDMGAIHHNIVEYGFKDFEKQRSTATRFGANYGVSIRINDATPENLSYTVVRKWKLK